MILMKEGSIVAVKEKRFNAFRRKKIILCKTEMLYYSALMFKLKNFLQFCRKNYKSTYDYFKVASKYTIWMKM